jgi:hypothetical protein
MNSLEQDTDGRAPGALVIDELLQWELKVAQRADELSSKTPHGRDEDLRTWLQAEREVLVNGDRLQALAPQDSAGSLVMIGKP